MIFRLPSPAGFFLGALLLAGLPVSAATQAKAKAPVVPPSPLNASGGPTAVYKISFGDSSSTDTVNYLPYNYGYYVAPIGGGTGSLLLTKNVNGANTVYVFNDFGQLFVANHGNKRKAVISCTTTSDVATTALFAIGEATETLASDDGSFVGDLYYATEMDGYSFSADALNDQLFHGTVGVDVGVAGSTPITVTFDQADSANATQNSLSVAATVTALQTRLTSQGFALATQNVPAAGTGTAVSDTTLGGTGDVLVYRLKFTRTGEFINFNHAQGGFYVTTAANGDSGTLILESKYEGKDIYEKFDNFGSMFVAKSEDDRKGVLFAAAPSTVANTTFFALGEANQTKHVDAVSEKGTIYFAKTLKGLAVSAESGEAPPFVGRAGAFGTAGMSHVTATYDETRSNEANKSHRTISAEAGILTKQLDADDYVSFTFQ